ncbi:MAG: putative pyrophosphatase [Parcubacteria group bacterium GW2011_GWC2_38_7]|nr:MAG: putative pyrophosphatase [Parcubacteria group bacterium GW2011_GWC2_38_7]
MTFAEYQIESKKTALYPNKGSNYIYPVLGLAGESGEVAEKIKKVIRDDGGIVSEVKKEEIKKEIGDVLWYLAQICSELGLSFDEAAKGNIEKLMSRMERGVLHGSGDNR